jgi:hypothetical protein
VDKHRIKPSYRRRVPRVPDLDHFKSAVLNSLGSPVSRCIYECSIDQVIAWYCSKLRPAPNQIPVVRCWMHVESRGWPPMPSNSNAAVRGLAARKRRLRFAESRISVGGQPSERSQATRVPLRQLVLTALRRIIRAFSGQADALLLL